MNLWIGWALAVVAIAVAFTRYGWQGVLLALTVVVFWLLLQFSRSVRALRDASGRPVGEVPNAVMLNARLRKGMRLPDVLKLTRSLGRQVGGMSGGNSGPNATEVFVWADAACDEVRITLLAGRVQQWELVRALDAAVGPSEPHA